MAGNELLSLLEYIEQERGITRDELIQALEKSLISAGNKSIDYGKDLDVKINKQTGKILATITLNVVDGPTFGENININEALAIDPSAILGSVIVKEIPHKEFGRIAAQTARQTMMQQLKKVEKERVYQDFKDSIGKVLSGIVRRFEGGSMIVDLQKAEGLLTQKDRIPGDDYTIGDRINVLLTDIVTMGSGPSLMLSRSNKKFLHKLMEREITEIADGVVEIKGIARDAGTRSKVAVKSNEPRVDPIGACIGIRGSRIKNITTELGGERVDIIRYDEDLEKYIKNALQPATPKSLSIDEENGVVNVIVDKAQVRLAIGKNWQNARLCGQLLGMRINIIPDDEVQETAFEKKVKEAITNLATSLKVSEKLAEKLVNSGILTADGLKAAGKDDITAIEGLSSEELNKLLEFLGK